MNQQPRTEVARSSRGQRSPQELRIAPRRSSAARVTVAWQASSQDGARSIAPNEFELVAALEASPMAPWTSAEHLGSPWLETLASARCSQVVLTARLGEDDLHAKHRVLELAELLTFELAATQPLIRVRFLPADSARRRERRSA
jgi:hypothetical protein